MRGSVLKLSRGIEWGGGRMRLGTLQLSKEPQMQAQYRVYIRWDPVRRKQPSLATTNRTI